MQKILPIVVVLLPVLSLGQPDIMVQHRDQYTQTHENSTFISYYINMTLAFFGVVLVVLEICVWRQQNREKLIVPFSVFHKEIQEENPSQSISHNDFLAGKTESMQVETSKDETSKDDSPAVKIIKGMTGK
jgi:hypothetical protein